MRICILGFGAAGLAAARHVTSNSRSVKHECIVFEQTDKLGGTWVYTEDIGQNKYGLPIHTSMYKSLRTNLPKEIMGYPDFPIPEQERSYLTAKEILGYLEQYAKNFDLLKYLKFNHHVRCVTPIGDEWEVKVRDLINNEDKSYKFDAVMVCNGHYHTPIYPTFPGLESFPGEQMHSHDYRQPDIFKDKRVIVIGAGPSGIDLSFEIASTASQVILSRHKNSDDIKNVFPDNVSMKFEITAINGKQIIFEDGTVEEADTLFYCTGYKYSFPFLSEECGIKVEENCVQPLYKHLIHVEHPTLCLIGLPYYVCPFPFRLPRTFNHHVRCVTPVGDEWEVKVRDLINNEDKSYKFDAVMVCNGHYHTPMYPTFPGLETFPGEHMHSHDYRQPDIFKDKRVIVIGAGPSGIDLSLEIASTASQVILSRHKNSDDIKNVFPDNVRMKFEITAINGKQIIFEDGTVEEADTLLYCTGYKYSFPFLSEECGIKIEENCVQPLYKHLIHVEHPSLCLIGLPYYVCPFPLFDLQVRYFLKVIEGEVKLPSREEMLTDTEQEMLKRKASGLKKKQFHMMGNLQADYFKELAILGNLPPLPPVMADLYNFASDQQLNDLIGFREHVYRILDENTFIKVN